MPIRFRCAYCNQLMGIARRKAGTVVRCPTCSGQVVVPNPEATGLERDDPEVPPAPAGNELFERSDFGSDLFHHVPPNAVRGAPGSDGGFHPIPQQPKSPFGGYDAAPVPAAASSFLPAPSPPGIFLTPGKLSVLAVLVVLLIGVAFFAGMLVGRS